MSGRLISKGVSISSVYDGKSAGVLKMTFDRVSYPANSSGAATSAYNVGTLQVSIEVDGSTIGLTSATLTIPQAMQSYISWGTQPYYGIWPNFTIANGANISGTIDVEATGYMGSETYKAYGKITIEPNRQGVQGQNGQNGNDGNPGHVGRWFYYAGEWSSATSYAFEKTQAPFVKRGSSFYMLDFGADQTKQQSDTTYYSQNQDPALYGSGAPWTLMSSEQKYYIAEAFFANYAHLGSFIINGDWMISQNGTYRGVSSNAYTYFDPQSPTGTKSISVQHGTIGTSWTVVGNPITALSLGHRVIRVTGKVVSGSTLTITLYNMGSATSATKTITSTSDTTVYLEIDVTDSSYNDYDVRAKMASGTGEVSVVELVSFAPTFAVDGKNGTTYQNNAQIKGTVYATNGEFTGTVHANRGEFKGTVNAQLFYTDVEFFQLTGNDVETEYISNGKQIVRVKSRGRDQTINNVIYLPYVAQNEGAVIDIYSFRGTGGSGTTVGVTLQIRARSGEAIINPRNDATSSVGIDSGYKARFYCDGSYWYWLEKVEVLPDQ